MEAEFWRPMYRLGLCEYSHSPRPFLAGLQPQQSKVRAISCDIPERWSQWRTAGCRHGQWCLTGEADASSSLRGTKEVLLTLLLMPWPDGVSALPQVISLLLCNTLLSQPARCWGDWAIKTSCSKTLLNTVLPLYIGTFCFANWKWENFDLLSDEEQWSCTLHRVVKKLNEWEKKKWLMTSAISFPRKQGYLTQ